MCATIATNTPSCPDTLVIYGSPHRDGVCGAMLDDVLKAHPTAMVVNCFERRVAPCDDCRGCHKTYACVKHDMDDVYHAIEHAETLIFLSPVYNRSFPAPMKAVIDRFQCYWARRFVGGQKPAVRGKKRVVILTTCGSDRDDGDRLVDQLDPLLTLFEVEEKRVRHIKGTDKGVL